ncbi:MAG TPA: DUF1702 family protein [Bacteroidota bacterium]|nr:DUF1702 family protein [Bacteroidota bacterium]
MIGSILANIVGGVIHRMRFPHQGEGGRAVSDTVLTTFQRGSELGLKGYAYEAVRNESLSLPWNVRAFFNEGHAMGAAGRSASLFQANPESMMSSSDYEVMRFVGYGFWNGVAAIYPVRRISEKASYWNTIETFPKYRLLMPNGHGFAYVLFRGSFDQQAKRLLMSVDGEDERRAMCHGVGRVLWFLYLNNPQALNNILAEHDDIAEHLAIGLGLAIAFTQAATPEKILRSIDEFPEVHRRNLVRGAAIALQVHANNDPECRKHVEAITGEMREWYEGARQASDAAGNGEHWYPMYHELTKNFASTKAYV